MGFFRRLLGKKEQTTRDDFMKDLMKGLEDAQNERTKEIQERHDVAAAQGMLPAPDIAVDYDCECGSKCTFHMRNLNLKGGLNVQCAKCGAVLHVPPTVLDHKEYWSAGDGASLVPNWRDQMRFIRKGGR